MKKIGGVKGMIAKRISLMNGKRERVGMMAIDRDTDSTVIFEDRALWASISGTSHGLQIQSDGPI